MRTKFDEQLYTLNQKMIQMGNMIEENIQMSIDALLNRDASKSRKIMEKDIEVDRMQKEIENICFQLLIQQQPVAKDLRNITAVMKMVTDMERIGDHAADISEMAIFLSETGYRSMNTITSMASEATCMLMDSIDAYVQKDEKRARGVIDHDDVVDDLFDQVRHELIEIISQNPQDGEQELDMLMIAHYFERIADHATNIAEWVLYSLDNHINTQI